MLTIERFLVQNHQNNYLRTQAINQIQELAERMDANPVAAYAGQYAATLPDEVKDCFSENCSPSELAEFDLKEWNAIISEQLPGSSSTVVVNDQVYTITLEWTDISGQVADNSMQRVSLNYSSLNPALIQL